MTKLIGEYTTGSASETISLGESFAASLEAGDVILYRGGMGMGKTHFTKGITRFFGYDDEATSPTFTLVNEYLTAPPVFHFDLFRLSDLDDLYAIGFFDYPLRDGIMAIEWSENIPALENEFQSYYTVSFQRLSGEERLIRIERTAK